MVRDVSITIVDRSRGRIMGFYLCRWRACRQLKEGLDMETLETCSLANFKAYGAGGLEPGCRETFFTTNKALLLKSIDKREK